MNDEEIPVLDTLGERLVAGIAAHGGRTRRARAGALAALAAAVVLAVAIAAVVYAAQAPSASHRVSVLGPARSGQPVVSLGATPSSVAAPASTTTPTTAANASPATPTTVIRINPIPATTAPPSPATTVAPARTPPSTAALAPGGPTISVSQATSGSITVTPGTTIVVTLTQCGIAYSAPTSSDSAVLTRVGVDNFRAAAIGTATLTATAAPFSPQHQTCPDTADMAATWSLTVTVD